jgi:hypothetical protein
MTESASATITVKQLDQSHYQYTITLSDTGSTSIGTFWFAWVPGEDFLASSPTSITAPAGWTDAITNEGASDGFAIQWRASSPSSDLEPAGALTEFSFVSSDPPSSVLGDSIFYPGTPVTTFFVYSGAPFSDSGFQGVATEALPTHTSDIMFRNDSSGDTWVELLSNGAFGNWSQIGGSNTSYAAVGVGDFFGNGTDDILFRNNSTGDTWIEQISNGAFANWQQVGGSDMHYSVVGVADLPKITPKNAKGKTVAAEASATSSPP